MHFFGTLVGAEEFEGNFIVFFKNKTNFNFENLKVQISETGRTLRECTVPLPHPWPTHTVQRNISPLKFYYDIQCGRKSIGFRENP